MFRLTSQYEPTGDQPEAIKQLVEGIEQGVEAQTLLGVTGSGKTFTVANVVAQLNRPTLVVSHNKTLAAQLYGEFKSFFPDNAVEYFVSYYDYYQPEAYITTTDTYIAKDMAINEDIEKLRLRATASLLSGRRDVIVVSSVSCLYGMADPRVFASCIISLQVGQRIARGELMRMLSEAYYAHVKTQFESGTFRVKGDTIDIFPAVEGYNGIAYRVVFWDDEIDSIEVIQPITGEVKGSLSDLQIYPANLFTTSKEQTAFALKEIKKDLATRVRELEEEGKRIEAERLTERVNYDVEMIEEIGYCTGIENYSRYFDGRLPGQRPFCLLDYFPKDFLLVVDESHVTMPQIKAMYGGDRSRKLNLVEYGFRLPAALDNRPLTFEEFERMTGTTIFVSATPAEYELARSEGVVVEQIIRPTGVPDPIIEVRPTENQVDDLMEEIRLRKERQQRVLVTTLTKRMAEELSEYLQRNGIATAYIHSDVETLDRVEILDDLRKGIFDVLVGVNLLREGLDLPEVSLVAIFDADKEGFLRSHRSLTQTAGRAARHVEGKVIFYADKITESMQQTIDDTNRRREKQLAYNKAHHITPRAAIKSSFSIVEEQKETQVELTSPDSPQAKALHSALTKGVKKSSTGTAATQREAVWRNEPKQVDKTPLNLKSYSEEERATVLDPLVSLLSPDKLKILLNTTRKEMYAAAKRLDFLDAARLRDEANAIEEILDTLGEKP